MVTRIRFLTFLAVIAASCTSFQTAGEIQLGRRGLLNAEPEKALAHFQRAAELDANYTFGFSPFGQSAQGYIGRAYYAMGKLPEALRALERARKENPQDAFAPLYLGLVLVRQGKTDAGRKEVTNGLRSLLSSLNYVTERDPYGRFWDPGREIETELTSLISLIESEGSLSDGLIPRLERIGLKIEEEVDRAKEDKEIELRESDDGPSS